MTCPDCDGTGKRSTLEGSITVLLDEPCRFCGGSGDVSLATAPLDVSDPPMALNEVSGGPACQHPSHAVGGPDEVDELRAERDRLRECLKYAAGEADVWRKEHTKAHSDWLETQKKCSEAERQRDECGARVQALEAACRCAIRETTRTYTDNFPTAEQDANTKGATIDRMVKLLRKVLEEKP